MSILIVSGPGETIKKALCGQIDSISEAARLESGNDWQVPRQSGSHVIVATIESGPESQNWDQFFLALQAASRITENAPQIVICTEIHELPDAFFNNLLQLPFESDNEITQQQLKTLPAHLREIPAILQTSSVFLKSHLGQDDVEELGLGFIESDAQIQRIVDSRRSWHRVARCPSLPHCSGHYRQMIPQKLLDEYRLIESQTAHVVLPDRTLLQFSGPDRRKFLHNFCTADINAMQQGDVREAFVLDSRGRTLAFGHVLDIDNDLWLTLPDSKFAGPLCTHFEKYVIREKVQITDVSNLFAAVLVFGGNVQLSPETAIELPVGNAKDFQFNKTPVIVAHDEFAGPAILFLVVRDEQTSLCTALASQGLVPCSMAALEMWRVEHLDPLVRLRNHRSKSASGSAPGPNGHLVQKGLLFGSGNGRQDRRDRTRQQVPGWSENTDGTTAKAWR